MRLLVLFFTALLLSACSSSSPLENQAEVIVKSGVIVSREAVDLEEAKRGSGVNTSVYASVSSGGRVSIGLGFLLSPFFGDDDPEPLRYEVELNDGSQMTIYHDSRDFEVDDCVAITVYPDEAEDPPSMKRNKGGCQ